MKTVRVWYKKSGTAKYISHLDLNRCMLRVIQRTKLPVWRTEGFNPHPFITFALPLSLGFNGCYETMDMKLLENIPYDEIIRKMNKCLPQGIEVFDVTEPVMKPGEIAKALFNAVIVHENKTPDRLMELFQDFFELDEILTEKKTKSGVKTIDLKPYLDECEIYKSSDGIRIKMVLPAGSSVNINPLLIISAAEKYYGLEFETDITREKIYNAKGEEFR